ncbi:MAG: hypothetical protein ACPGVO_10290 [Spirulinaceae cyanobacterium]
MTTPFPPNHGQTNGHSPRHIPGHSPPRKAPPPSPTPQEIVDAEFLEQEIPPDPMPSPSGPLGVADLDSVAQQLNQFEHQLSHQLQLWQYQQTQLQGQDRQHLLQQLWDTQEQTQHRFRRLYEHLRQVEQKLDQALQERRTESSRRSIFVLLGVFVLAIAYITVGYPLLHRPLQPGQPVTPSTPSPPLPSQIQPQTQPQTQPPTWTIPDQADI